MIRQRSMGAVVAMLAVLALVVLFLPGGAMAQDGDSSTGDNGQQGQIMREAGANDAGMNMSSFGQMHTGAGSQQVHRQMGRAATSHAMMPMNGMGNHSHMGGMMGTGAMMHDMSGAGAMHLQHMAGEDQCPYADEHADECAAQHPAAEED